MGTIATGLASTLTWDSAIAGRLRLCALVNGIDRSRITDFVGVYEMGLDVPPAKPTFNSNINGALDASSNYYFKFVYRRSIHGTKISNPSPASDVMTTGADPNDAIKINIPANASLQSGVDYVDVYRTHGNALVYFYDGTVAYSGSAVTYDSILGDTSLGSTIQTDNDIPVTRPYIEYFDGRYVIWGSKTHSAGTVAVVNGSATITFTSALITRGHVGATFNNPLDGGKEYFIGSVDVANQTATLEDSGGTSETYAGSNNATATYTLSFNALVLQWSKIDSAGRLILESFPAANMDDVGGAPDGNEKGAGLGKTSSYLLPFTNRNTYYTMFTSANQTNGSKPLHPGVGLMGNRTIANASETGACMWLDQNAEVRSSMGSGDSLLNLSENFVKSLLNGTHVGTHRNLVVDTSKYADFHAIYYGFRQWYMLFITLSGSTYPNACLICDLSINPTGSAKGLSPWMLWTGFTAIASSMELDSDGNLRPFFSDDLGFKWQMDTGTNDGVPSGTATGTITAADATTLTDSGGAFYTTGDGLKGVRVRTYHPTTKALTNDIVIASNNGTVLTVAAWTTTPAVGETYKIGGIIHQRYSKAYNENQPKLIKRTNNLYITSEKASSTTNITIYHFKDFGTTAEIIGGQDIDLSSGYSHEVNIKARGKNHQFMIENTDPDKPVEILSLSREVLYRGDR
ncbi:MAG: hypothetical protein KAV18_06245 [Candidatus Omnitrophica bacterium]|nr:hypothetical protein [Candidatus Omnitrophota bacterium]